MFIYQQRLNVRNQVTEKTIYFRIIKFEFCYNNRIVIKTYCNVYVNLKCNYTDFRIGLHR